MVWPADQHDKKPDVEPKLQILTTEWPAGTPHQVEFHNLSPLSEGLSQFRLKVPSHPAGHLSLLGTCRTTTAPDVLG